MAERCFKAEVGGALVCVVRLMGRGREFYKKLQIDGRTYGGEVGEVGEV